MSDPSTKGEKAKARNARGKGTEDWLWEWFDNQERYNVEEFGIGIVGIGALFFAYTQARFPLLKILIALIGLGGSLTLLMHMYGARMTRNAILQVLRVRNDRCPVREEVITNRKKRTNRLYYPPGWMMIYYMALVSFAWVAIIGYRLSVILQAGLNDNVRLGGVGMAGVVFAIFVAYNAMQRKQAEE